MRSSLLLISILTFTAPLSARDKEGAAGMQKKAKKERKRQFKSSFKARSFSRQRVFLLNPYFYIPDFVFFPLQTVPTHVYLFMYLGFILVSDDLIFTPLAMKL